MASRSTLIVLVAAVLALSTPRAAAQEVDDAARAAARELAQEGGALFEAGDHAGAFEKLDRAYHVLTVPTLGYWSARSLEQLGRWVEAAERYLEVTRLPLPSTESSLHDQARRDAAQARSKLLPRIPRLTVTIAGSAAGEATVAIDGKTLPRALVGTAVPLDPGPHDIVAQAGAQRAARQVTLAEGASERVEMELEADPAGEAPAASTTAPPPAPPPPRPAMPPDGEEPASTWRAIGWTGVAVGGAFAAGGIACGVALLVIDGELSDRCDGDRCPPTTADDVDLYNTLRPLATVGLVVGAVGLGVGITLLLLEPAPQDKSTLSLTVSPSGATLVGGF